MPPRWSRMWSGSVAPLTHTGGRTLRFLASFTLRARYHRGKSVSFPLSMGMCGSQKSSGCVGEVFCFVNFDLIITHSKHNGFKTTFLFIILWLPFYFTDFEFPSYINHCLPLYSKEGVMCWKWPVARIESNWSNLPVFHVIILSRKTVN